MNLNNPEGFNQENGDENDLEMSVVDRNMLQGRILGTVAKLSDLDHVHSDLCLVEDGINRTVRLLNRRVNQTDLRMNQLSDEINASFVTVRERVDGLELRVEAIGQEGAERVQNEENRHGNERDDDDESNPEEQNPNDGWMDEEIFQINMLSAETNQVSVSNFMGDSVIEFDKWAKKFVDFLDFHGDGWAEAKKLNRFKLFLDGTPRRIFDNLADAEKATLANVMANVRAKLDSPQRRELTYQALAACKQKDGETVKAFLDRLIPLVEATSINLTATAREEILCRTLLEKLKPEISFILRTAGLAGRKNFDELCMQAQEAEIMLMNTPRGGNVLPQANAVSSSNPPNFPQGNFQTWAPTGGNAQPIGTQGQGNQQNGSKPNWQQNQRPNNWNRNNAPYGQRRGGGGNRNQPWNERRWSSKPICHYCSKPGHIAFKCFKRQRDFMQNAANQVSSGENDSRLVAMVEDLVADVHGLKLKQHENVAAATKQVVNMVKEMPEKEAAVQEKKKPIKITGWEIIKSPNLLPLYSVMLFAVLVAPTLAGHGLPAPRHPMICQTQQQGMIWELPKVNLCPEITPRANDRIVPVRRIVLAPNALEYSTAAWACRKVRKNARKYTTLSNVPIEQLLDSDQLEITLSECKRIIEHKRCDLGTLKNNSGLWATENKVDLTPRMWFLGSFGWKPVSSENCYAFETKVESHFGAKTIITPAGVTQDCPYQKGYCVLDDKTVLVWTPEAKKMCGYMPIGAWDGQQLGKIWLSNGGGIGLTFSEEKTVVDCGRNLSISDQGLAVQNFLTTSRRKRQAEQREMDFNITEGAVTSSQLAAQLTYLHSN